MRCPKRWNLATPHQGAVELAAKLKTSPLIAQILLNRGLKEAQECQDFLRPSLKCLHNPASLAGVAKASQRIAKAIRDREKIVIYGDYDVDGITATAILWHAIRILGGSAEYYIPHRIDEGYGLNAEALTQLCDAGARVIITVDCGITAVTQAALAKQRGVDLIITDHHEWHETPAEGSTGAPLLPDCHAIVHPRLQCDGNEYSNPALCGAGVAFKLAWGVGLAMSGADRVSDIFRGYLIDATALAALGTIADVVPLTGENRILAHFGLTGLRQTSLVGIKALIASAGLAGQNLDSFHVGFLLAPRLNACGRMGHARLAVEMLTSADETRAGEIAAYLEEQNRERQTIERKILDEAIEQITRERLDADGNCAIVLGSEGWHAGVIGIVASRIVDRYHRPTVMVAMNNGHGQGSGRSIAGFHLAHALESCREHLETYGGHEMAAGLKLETARFGDFRSAFCAHAGRTLTADLLTPELKLDCVAELEHMTEALVRDLNRLGPFGHGNRRPLLCCRGLEIAYPPRRVGGSGDHLQIHLRQGEFINKCIGFGYGSMYDQLPQGARIDVAIEPSINEYNGRTSVELEIRDLQLQAV